MWCGWHGATWCHSVRHGQPTPELPGYAHACTPARIRHAAETLLTLAARRAAPGGRQPLPYAVGLVRTPTPPNNGCFGQCGRVGKFSIECSTDDTCMGLLFDGPTSNWHKGTYSVPTLVRPYIPAPSAPCTRTASIYETISPLPAGKHWRGPLNAKRVHVKLNESSGIMRYSG